MKRRGKPSKNAPSVVESTPVVKTRRGRTPKRKTPPAESAPPDTPVRSNVSKKTRGRPPKNSQPAKAAAAKGIQEANNSVIPVPGSVAVPANSRSLVMPLFTPQSNPGSNSTPTVPVVTHGESIPPPGTEGSNPEATVPQKSRSGRTVKRNPFHDEIYESQQHMRTARPPPAQDEQQAVAQPPSASESQVIDQTPSYQAHLHQTKTVPISNPVLAQQAKPPPKIVDAAPLTQDVKKPAVPAIRETTAPASSAMPAASVMPMSTLPTTIATTTMATTHGPLPVPPAVLAFPSSVAQVPPPTAVGSAAKVPRRKPGARECMQMSRRFGVQVIPQNYMDTLLVRFMPDFKEIFAAF